MSAKEPKPNRQLLKLALNPDDLKGDLKAIGGSKSDVWNNLLMNQVIQALWLANSDVPTQKSQMGANVAALAGIGPKDVPEAMIAAQMLAAHNAALECYRRAMLPEQSFDARRENLAQASKLSRTCATLVEALNRYRGKGQQTVTVQHVSVNSGGQAVVGMMASRGGGDESKPEEQPHAQQIGHAPERAMLRTDEGRQLLPIGGDEERPMPDARRTIARRAAR